MHRAMPEGFAFAIGEAKYAFLNVSATETAPAYPALSFANWQLGEIEVLRRPRE
jgi:hypothetical protein